MENINEGSGVKFVLTDPPEYFNEPNAELEEKVAYANKIGLGEVVRDVKTEGTQQVVKTTKAAQNYVYKTKVEALAARKAASETSKKSRSSFTNRKTGSSVVKKADGSGVKKSDELTQRKLGHSLKEGAKRGKNDLK